jgi:hypothetical protein
VCGGEAGGVLRYLVFCQNVFMITAFLNFVDERELQVIA